MTDKKVDSDRVKGSATNLGGKLKEGLGNLTGDAKLKGEGKADQTKGKAQNAFGGIKDAARDLADGTNRASIWPWRCGPC